MSEYQYYEFVAIDRPLTHKGNGRTARAAITATGFVNDYFWSDRRRRWIPSA